MQIEPGYLGEHIAAGYVHRACEFAQHRFHAHVTLVGDEHRSHGVTRCDEPLDHVDAFSNEELIALEPLAMLWVAQTDVVGHPRIVGTGDRDWFHDWG